MTGPETGESRTADLGALVHYVDFGGTSDRPTLVLVHGLGGSHLNWDLLAPELTRHGRVLALDLPGFGMSRPTRRPATVRSNVAVLARFVREIAGPPVVLVGNSMGGLVSVLLTSREPHLVRGLVLLDPALPALSRVLRSPANAALLLLHALPGVGERLRRNRRRRIGARATVHETLRLCGVDVAALPEGLVERYVALVEQQSDIAGIDRAFLSASRSLAWTLVRTKRFRAAMSSIPGPVLLVHGDQDRLVPVTAARATARDHPAWRYAELPGVGHLPQLQAPHELVALTLEWLEGLPAAAAGRRPASRRVEPGTPGSDVGGRVERLPHRARIAAIDRDRGGAGTHALVVVESVFGNTRRIAEAIAHGLSAATTEVRLVDVADAPSELGQVDLVVVGGPTHGFGMTRPSTRRSAARQSGVPAAATGLREWLDTLPGGTGDMAVFDTRVAPPRTPGASRGVARRMQRLGYRLVVQSETFRVMDVEGPLCDGELERARTWGEVLAARLPRMRPPQRH